MELNVYIHNDIKNKLSADSLAALATEGRNFYTSIANDITDTVQRFTMLHTSNNIYLKFDVKICTGTVVFSSAVKLTQFQFEEFKNNSYKNKNKALAFDQINLN